MSSDEEAEFNGESEPEEELDGESEDLPAKRSRTVVHYKDADSDNESSEDDVPLAALAKKNKAPTKSNGTKQSADKKKKPEPAKRKAAPSTPKSPPAKKNSNVSVSSNTNKSFEWASAAFYGLECTKGQLIQKLLCRWWYAYTWPDPADIPSSTPNHFDALDGFPGVYIGTSGDHVGTIMDRRDKSKCPSFKNFAKKTSEELREMLLRALQHQKTQLIEHEGKGTSTEKEIDAEIKWATKLNTSKADKEAEKILKAHNLKLP